MTISARMIGACLLACSVSAGALAQAGTDWDSLKSSDWGSSQSRQTQPSAPEQSSGAKASPGQDAGTSHMADSSGSTGIKQAFVKLGMAEPRAACYQDVLSQQLSPDEQERAAKIVSESSDADEVRTNVVTAGPTIMGGFSAADAKCPEGMGS